jgi:hypothetical protein
MKKILLAFLALLVIACDNRKDPYYNIDDTPVVTVTKLTDSAYSTAITDSVKLGLGYSF